VVSSVFASILAATLLFGILPDWDYPPYGIAIKDEFQTATNRELRNAAFSAIALPRTRHGLLRRASRERLRDKRGATSMLKKLALAALFAASLSTAANAVDVGGTYDIQGTNPNGTKYSGTAEIVVTSENTCRITWNTGNESSGICMRNGTAFAAGYVLGEKVGLIIYEMHDDGTLDGLWTIADQEGVGTELLTPK
jgi:hypothetical protein